MASREDFEVGMTVIDTKTHRRGTVVHDWYGVCAPEEVAVRFDGEKAYLGVDWQDLCLFDFN